MTTKRTLYFVLICLQSILITAQSYTKQSGIMQFTAQNGLANNTLSDLYQDQTGFLWIATDIGLSRHDGIHFHNYNLVKTEPVAVCKIVETENRYLWLETLEDNGMACFDKEQEKYIPLYSDKEGILNHLTSICTAEDKIYALLHGGIVEIQIDKEADKFKITPRLLTDENRNYAALYEKEQNLYAVSNNELLIYATHTAQSTYVSAAQLGMENMLAIENLYVYNGHLWICSQWAGVTCYDPKTQTHRKIACPAEGESTHNPQQYVLNMAQPNRNTLLLSTAEKAYQMTLEAGGELNTPYELNEIPLSSTGEMTPKFTSLLFDKKNNIAWMGTFGNGLIQFRLLGSHTGKIALDKALYQLNGLAQDANGHVWLATEQNGIYKSVEKNITAQTQFAPWSKVDGHSSFQLFKDKNSHLWLGDEKGNVVHINPVTDEVHAFTPLPEAKKEALSAVKVIFLDSRNQLWLATEKGLILYDCNTNQHLAYRPYDNELATVTAIKEDGDGVIWIGTDKGLKQTKWDNQTIGLTGEYEKEAGLSPKKVIALYVNNYNQLFASYLDKMIQVDGRTHKVTASWVLLKNLPQGHITCMVDDKDGNTWLGSNEGILTIHNKSNTYYTYPVAGSHQQVCRLSDGRLLWITPSGLTYFDPRELKEKGTNREVLITGLAINNQQIKIGEEVNGQVILNSSPSELKHLTLNAENHHLTLLLSDLSFEPNAHRVHYRLMPNEPEWRETTNGQIALNTLKAGKYTLEIKPIYPGAEAPQLTTLEISVSPYWAFSVWAITVYVLLFIALIAGIINYIKRRERKKEYYRKTELQLKEKLQVATESRKEENESHQMRNQLQAMIAKELRSPLSLVTGPLREMVRARELSDPLQKQALMAYRSAICIQDSCNQLLDLYQQEDYTPHLQVAPYPASKVGDSVVRSFQELLNASPIKLQYDKDNKINTEVWVDRKKVEFVLRNMLSNACRRIAYAGSIRLSINQTMVDDKGYCLFCLSDEGNKTANGETKDEALASELGFEFMEKIADTHRGRITVDHRTPESTQITFQIPLGKKHFEGDKNVTFIEPEEIIIKDETQDEITLIANEETQEQIISVAPKTGNAGKNTVLIIEDHQDIRLYLQVLFANDYHVLTAENGEEGLKTARKELPDLVITDVMMPVMTGFECCRLLKEDLKTCHIPIILLTALVEDEDVVKGIELGADDYILKPFNPEILRSKAKRLIKSRQELKQAYTKLLMPSTSIVQTEEEPIVVEDPFIAQVLQIVNDNLQNPDFSVKRLAEMVNMSQPTLYRRVKQITNFTIIELIRGVRLKRSAELLKTRQYNVQEVAEKVGYNDIPTFRKHFVDFYGTTPSAYNNKDAAEDKK